MRYTPFPTALTTVILSLGVVVAQCEPLSLRASRRASRINALFPPDTATYDPAHLPPTTEGDQRGALHLLRTLSAPLKLSDRHQPVRYR